MKPFLLLVLCLFALLAGYSCITSVDEEHIGILYEGSQAHMTFQKIEIEEFLDKF